MVESRMQLAEFGYLYYSLYSYRRKIEADIKNIIKADTQDGLGKIFNENSFSGQDKAKNLQELTQKLRTISFITSKVISLNKGYKRC